jgi:hypothetical protein
MAQISVLLIGVGLGGIFVYWSHAVAIKRGRSPRPWMWLAAIFGPIALPVLALLPKKSSDGN